MGFLKDAILRIEEGNAPLKLDFNEIMTAITKLQTRKTFAQYRAARDRLYQLAYENPAQLVPLIDDYLDRIGGDREARARSHMHLTNAIVICHEELRPEAATEERERILLTARKALAFDVIARLAKGVPVGHILNLMLVGEKGEAEDAHLALGWLDHFQQPDGWVALKAVRMLTEALEKVRRDAAMSPAQRALYLVNGTSAFSKLVKIHADHPYVGEAVVRLLAALLEEEDDEVRYNAGHVLAHIVRRAATWPRGIDDAVFAKLLAGLADAGRPLGAKGAFDALEMLIAKDPAFDPFRAAQAAWRLAEIADAAHPHAERAYRIFRHLVAAKRAELARVDTCAQRLRSEGGVPPDRLLRGLAALTDVGVEEIETAAIAAIRLILDQDARAGAPPLADDTGRLLRRLLELGPGKSQEFRDELELLRGNRSVKRVLKRLEKEPAPAPRAAPPRRPTTWNEAIAAYLTANPVGEEIQRHLAATSFDVATLLRKTADRQVGGLAATALRDAYAPEYAAQLGEKDARALAVAVLRSLGRHEDRVKVSAIKDLFLRLEEDLLAADRGPVWDAICAEFGKGIDDRRAELGPLAMKALCLLAGPPRENTAIVARVPDSIDLDGELAAGRLDRPPRR